MLYELIIQKEILLPDMIVGKSHWTKKIVSKHYSDLYQAICYLVKKCICKRSKAICCARRYVVPLDFACQPKIHILLSK